MATVKKLAILLLGLLLIFLPFAQSWMSTQGGFLGIDDALYVTIIKQFRSWSEPFNLTAINFFQGMGSFFLPRAVMWNPGSWFYFITNSSTAYILSTSLYFAIHFLACAFLLRSLEVKISTIFFVFVLQLSTALVFHPVCNEVGFYCQYSVDSNVAFNISMCFLFLGLFLRSLDVHRKGRTKVFVLSILVILFGVINESLWFVVNMISLSAFLVGGGIYAAFNDRPALKKGAIFVFALAVTLQLTGVFNYIAVLFGNTARAFFRHEIYGEVQDRNFSALAFRYGPANLLFFLFIIGSLLALLRPEKKVRMIAAGALFHLTFLSVMSSVYIFTDINWTYPIPIYFELVAWPIYIMISVLGYAQIPKLFWRQHKPFQAVRWRAFAGFTLVPLIVIVLMLAKGMLKIDWSLSPTMVTKTQLIDYIIDRSKLTPGGDFLGYTTSFIGVDYNAPKGEQIPFDAYEMSKNYPSFIKHNFGGNNIFRLVGLWEFGIPTLEEYSQLVTPSYYYLTSRLLNRPIDYQSRNFVLISKINGPVLKMMGVRFIISDKQLETLAGYNQVALQTGIYGGQLFLYSTDDYNSGGYSPTRWQKIATGKEMIDVLARQSDFGEAVVTDVELPNNLARIVQVRMKFDANAVTISGLVQGTGGLLVLPLQFTHCWKIKTASTKARVVPVNLAMAGLLLEQTNPLSNFEVTLHNDFGPFSSGCRQQDIDRNQALRLKEDGTKAIRTDRHPMVQYTW